ncbi:GNAT family N-acetyltransferase [Spirosoma lituiforme]
MQRQGMKGVIYQNGSLDIRVDETAGLAGVALLKRTIYGTNGVRYQHTGQEQKASQLHKPLFFQLRQDNELIGLYCLDERCIKAGSEYITAFYGRYLAVDDRHKSKGYGRLLKQEAIRYVEQYATAPSIFYAYIEEKNARSLSISLGEGFQSVATLKSYIFRRYTHQIDFRFRQVDSHQLDAIRSLLEKAYAAYTFTNFAHIGYQNNYFVLEENGEIIAGIQANPVRWQFLDMPGLGGWVMMHLLPALSMTRRFFNPANYQFVVLEGLYLKKGAEDRLYALLESVLAHFRLHSALWQIDSKDPHLALLTTAESGPLSGFQKAIRTHVLVKAVGINESQLALDLPQYISCFDFA